MANNKGNRRRFGAVRQYRSGRWTASYLGPEGTEHRSPNTFETKRDAEIWLSQIEADITRENWIDPDAGKVLFGAYANQWVADHPKLAVSTRDLYEILLRLHIGPTFKDKELRAIKEPNVRAWRARLLKNGVGQVTVAKSYRLLKAILHTAEDDGAIKRNPCRIKGGGEENSPERPTLTLDEVFRVADAIDDRYRAMVLIATFLGFRLGELAGLRRDCVDLEGAVIHVRRVGGQTNKGTLYEKDPKSKAGKRAVSIPDVILPMIENHLKEFTGEAPEALLFLGPRGAKIRRNNFNRIWKRALLAAGTKDVHFHDLRHTGNTLAASTGASLRELMARMGHSSTRAALIYQHATAERDKEIAAAVNARIMAARKPLALPEQSPRKSTGKTDDEAHPERSDGE